MSLSLLALLHLRWVSWRLERSSGDPPFARGMISSISARIGCGVHPVHSGFRQSLRCLPGMYFNVLLTGCPQMPQLVSSALTRATSCRRRCPLPPSVLVRSNAIVDFLMRVGVRQAGWPRGSACPTVR